MIRRVYLSAQDGVYVDRILAGLGDPGGDQWMAARLALARSLQFPDAPDIARYGYVPASDRRREIASQQMVGEGKEFDEDFANAFRAILSTYHAEDLFAGDDAFNVALQAHVRRGLETIDTEWSAEQGFAEYLLTHLYVPGSEASEGPAASASADLPGRLDTILGEVGVNAEVVEAREGPRMTQLTLRLSTLDDLPRLRQAIEKIEFALGADEKTISMRTGSGDRRVFLYVPRPPRAWQRVTWEQVRPHLRSEAAASYRIPIVLGTDVLGAPTVFDLVEAPHLFVGGTTGSGKSICLHALILSMIEGPEPPELILIDPKGVEFVRYRGSRFVRGGAPTTDMGEAVAILEGLIEEMDRRQALFVERDVRDVDEARAKGMDVPRLVAVIDELADLVMTHPDVVDPLGRLAQKARSTGIHLVLATQRPDASIFAGTLRSNVPSRIALTVQKATESRIILDEGGAENLLMRGDMLVRLAGTSVQRMHGCLIEASDIQDAVQGR